MTGFWLMGKLRRKAGRKNTITRLIHPLADSFMSKK